MTKNTHQDHSAGTGGPNGFVSIPDGKKSAAGHWKSQELHLIDIFGKRLSLTLTEILDIIYDVRIAGILLLNAVTLYAIDPHGYRGHMSEFWALTIWLGATIVVMFLYMSAYVLTAIMHSRNWFSSVYTPIISAVVYIPLFLGVARFSYAVSYDDYMFNFTLSFPFLFFSFLMLELFFMRFVIPSVLERVRDANNGREPASIQAKTVAEPVAETAVAPGMPKPPTPNNDTHVKTLCLAGRKIRLETLMWMRSEEHYVHVYTNHETLTVRAKLPSLLDQIPLEYGIRCHRSWWVSRRAEPTIQKCPQGICLVTANGDEAPIARSRKNEVQDWIDQYRDW